jgi:hypothetical protein
LIADTKDALTIRHDNNIHIRVRSVPQEFDNGIALRIPNEHAARSAVNVTELLTGQRNGWRVNNWRHLLDVLEKKSIEEDLVVILQSAQLYVPVEIVLLSRVGLMPSRDLLLQRFNARRKQSVQPKLSSLCIAERCAFV